MTARCITSMDDLVTLLDYLDSTAKDDWLALDVENRPDHSLCGVSLAWGVDEDQSVYIPIAHYDGGLGDPAVELLARVLGGEWHIACHYGQHEAEVLAHYEIYPQFAHDSYIAARLVYFHNLKGFDLKTLAAERLGMAMTHIEDLPGFYLEDDPKHKRPDFFRVPVDFAAPYSADDALATYRLLQYLFPHLDHNHLWPTYKLEVAQIPIAQAMHENGLGFDPAAHAEILTTVSQRVDALAAQAAQTLHDPAVLSSPELLSLSLYGHAPAGLALPAFDIPVGKKGFVSTGADYLARLSLLHEVIPVILEWRKMSKLLSTYLMPMPSLLGEDGRLHPTFDPFGTVHGRYASSAPNAQNFPKKGWGRLIRRFIVPRPGCSLLAVDYKMIEFVVAAAMSGDPTLRQMILDGRDVHTATWALMNGMLLEAVTGDERDAAKAINYGLVYGMGPGGLLAFTGGDWEAAQALYARYFQVYPGLQELFSVLESRLNQGHTRTMGGRIIALPDLTDATEEYIAFARRIARNYPICGTAADLMKAAMVAVAKNLPQFEGTRLLAQIHDELLLEVPDEDMSRVAGMVQAVMTSVPFPLPLRVEMEVGKNWFEMQGYALP